MGSLKMYRVRWSLRRLAAESSHRYSRQGNGFIVMAMGIDYFLALSPARAALQAERRVPERAHRPQGWGVVLIRGVEEKQEDGTYVKVDALVDG